MSLQRLLLPGLLVLVVAGAWGTCASAAEGPSWKPRLARAHDQNPDPGIVEVELVAEEAVVDLWPGSRTRVWAYNGSVPGPLIEANVGDRIIVHFMNNLPEATTVHWHGVEVPADMDGSNISQREVPPGGTFRYEFQALNAATYWYHPHRSTNEQVERGLYGALVFRDPQEEERLAMSGVEEHILLVDDILLDESGQIAPFVSDPEAAFSPLERAERQLNGREGNVLLVNGRRHPSLTVREGVPQRWRIINAANARSMLLSIPDHVMQRIGGDQGLLDDVEPIQPVGGVGPAPEHVTPLFPPEGLMLTPSERADVIFTPRGDPGEDLELRWYDFGRGRHTAGYGSFGTIEIIHTLDDGFRGSRPLMRLHLARGGSTTAGDWVPPSPLRVVPQVEIPAAVGVTGILPIFFGHSNPDSDGNVNFFAAVRDQQGVLDRMEQRLPVPVPQFGPTPFAAVDAADAHQVEVGEARIWEVINFTGGDHPFHTHGFPFQLIEYEWVDLDSPAGNFVIPRPFLETKDTIRVPRRQGLKGRSWVIARLAVRFDDSLRPQDLRRTPEQLVAFGKMPQVDLSGGWLAHCHILEHSARGMMTFLNLVLPGTTQ